MAKNDNLKDYLTDLANAIREKKGTTAPINPQDFASEIASIEAGGGSTSSWRYFDISKLDNSMKPMTAPFIVKVVKESDKKIVSPSIISDWTTVTAFGVDDSPKLCFPDLGIMSWSEAQAGEGLTPEIMAQVGIVEITEEQFYTL